MISVLGFILLFAAIHQGNLLLAVSACTILIVDAILDARRQIVEAINAIKKP